MSDWSGVMHMTPEEKKLESDAELRARVRYIAADGNYLTRRIETAIGEDLDDLAAMFNLRRRLI